MDRTLKRCIEDSIKAYEYDNALFLCERLVSSYKTAENLILYGHCYLKAGKPKKARMVVKMAMSDQSVLKTGHVAAECRFLFALCW